MVSSRLQLSLNYAIPTFVLEVFLVDLDEFLEGAVFEVFGLAFRVDGRQRGLHKIAVTSCLLWERPVLVV